MTKQNIPLLDFRLQHATIRDEVLEAVTRVIDSQRFILGEEVWKLEQELAAYCSSPFAIGCGSGSDALLLALMACDVGPGDKVLTTPFTFFATAGTIARLHATPVFADIDPHTLNMDPALAAEALATHGPVKAIIPVHLYGGCADMDPIMEAAGHHGSVVIEDAAQAIGAEYKGKRAGSIGAFGCFSFYPSKNLGGYGEGGLVTTGDEQLAGRLGALRVHGGHRTYYHDEVGLNSRLDALQAAVLRVKLGHLDAWTAARQRNAALYQATLNGMNLPLQVPQAAAWQSRHVWNQFVIRAERRDSLQAWLREQGIGTSIYYPLPLHLQPCFHNLGYARGAFPVSEQAALSVLALPVYPELTEAQIESVCQAIQRFYA